MDKDLDQIIEGAIILGFIDLGNDEYQCTKQQLIMLCCIVAQQTVIQVEEWNNA